MHWHYVEVNCRVNYIVIILWMTDTLSIHPLALCYYIDTTIIYLFLSLSVTPCPVQVRSVVGSCSIGALLVVEVQVVTFMTVHHGTLLTVTNASHSVECIVIEVS